jgi:hypothetical protein
MATDTKAPLRQLPDRPSLRHLRAQARDLLKAGDAKSTAEAQFKIARQVSRRRGQDRELAAPGRSQ